MVNFGAYEDPNSRALVRARGRVLGRASAAYRYSLANELEGRAGPLLKADRLKFERLRSALGQRREQRGVPLRQSYRDDTQKEDLTKHGKPDRFAGIPASRRATSTWKNRPPHPMLAVKTH